MRKIESAIYLVIVALVCFILIALWNIVCWNKVILELKKSQPRVVRLQAFSDFFGGLVVQPDHACFLGQLLLTRPSQRSDELDDLQ